VRVALLSLALLSLGASAHAATATKIVVLHQSERAAEEELLTEALRIYTRDLDCEVVVQGAAPAPLAVPSLPQLQDQARQEGAEDLLWVGPREGGGATYYTFDLVSGDLRETQVGPAGAPTAAQEVALKVRVLLSSRRRRAAAEAPAVPTAPRNASDGAPSASPATAPAGPAPSVEPVRAPAETAPTSSAPPGPVDARPAPPPPDSTAETVAVRSSAADGGPYRPARVALGVGFGVVTPRDRTWARNGLIVDLAARLGAPRGDAGLWVYAEGALTSHPTANVRGFDLRFADLPFTAGALLRWRGSHGSLALGSRTTLHVFDITADAPDGRAASTRKYTIGLGGLARAEAAVGRHIGVFLEASVEALVPGQDFTIAGEGAASTGDVQYGAVAGVALAVP
jgi:hypothetical protein